MNIYVWKLNIAVSDIYIQEIWSYNKLRKFTIIYENGILCVVLTLSRKIRVIIINKCKNNQMRNADIKWCDQRNVTIQKRKIKVMERKYTILSQTSALNWPCEMDTSKLKYKTTTHRPNTFNDSLIERKEIRIIYLVKTWHHTFIWY